MTRRSDPVADRTVAVVLAGGKGTRLDPLTRNICKPALPFGGSFRCIDFSLSNCVNSGLRRIAVATQYKPEALLAHLWARWNSVAVGDATLIRAWRAEERAERFGYCGTADAIYRNLASIRDLEDSLVLVLAGDHVYKMDYRPMLEAHVARNAGVTIGCVEVPLAEARRLGCLAVGGDARVERFVEKPKSRVDVPAASRAKALASMGIYVFDGAVLAPVLATDAGLPHSGHDFATDILPRLLEGGRAYSYELRRPDIAAEAYWRDVGTLQSYWQAHMDLLGSAPLLTLDDPSWPLGRVGAAPRSVTTTMTTVAGGTVANSIVAARCSVAGHVQRSVVSDDVEIGAGAAVTETVLLTGASVGAGSRLHGVIVDTAFSVPDGTVVERSAGSSVPPVLSAQDRPAAAHTSLR
jgi:glucose-1-phosphate adenylyltransferase